MLEKYAQELAESTASIIGYDVVITDMDGIIIGCSDPARGRGTLYEAALRVIESRIGKIDTIEDAKKLIGTKPGVTYPVERFPGNMVGTIAITGDPDKVKPFALIVKKHAELFLREKLAIETAMTRESTIQNLIQNITSFNPEKDSENMLLARAQSFGFDPTRSYTAITVDISKFGHYASEVRRNTNKNGSMQAELLIHSMKTDILMDIRGIFDSPQDIASVIRGDQYVILHSPSASTDLKENSLRETVHENCTRLLSTIEKRGLQSTIGIGSIIMGIQGLSRSCTEAWLALEFGRKMYSAKPGIYDIENFRIEQILMASKRELLKSFIHTHLEDIKKASNWRELRETVLTWCNCSFSTVRTAEKLHIHRNTLDYRLDKIHRISQYNPRDFGSILKLYHAFKLENLIGDDEL